MKDYIRLDADDNVVTATHALEVGVEVADGKSTTQLIPSGHKVEGPRMFKTSARDQTRRSP